MASLTDVFVTVKPDMDKFGPEVKKKLGRIDASSSGKQVAGRFGAGFNSQFGGISKRAAGLFAAGFAAIKGVQVFGSFIADAAESEKISRITANAIKATGGAAKISADQVSALATSISNKTAIDDEQIQTAANMLLTFKNIRNETGKGNDVFNQATQAAADLSVQFGGIDGASKQLGKALNDPIKGTTALAKAGVTFTDQQKKQIETLVKSGDTLGAQKIILQEISSQVGGAAAAAAAPMDRLKVIAGNLGEQFGGFLLPAAEKVATFLSDKAAPAVSGLFNKFQSFTQSQGFQSFLGEVEAKAQSTFGYFKAEVLPRLREFGSFLVGTAAPAVAAFGKNLATTLGPTVKDVFGFFKAEVLPRLKELAEFIAGTVIPTIGNLANGLAKDKDILIPLVAAIAGGVVVFKVVTTVIKAWTIAQGILNAVLTANPIGLVIAAVALLVAGVIIAYKKSDTFRTIVDTAFRVVAAAGKFMWDNVLKPMFEAFKLVIKSVWEQVQTFGRIFKSVFDAVKEPARAAIKFVVDMFLGMVETVLTGAAKAFGWVPGLGEKLKTAAGKFATFRDEVNAKLSGINDQTINVKPVFDAATMSLASAGRRATGGPGGPVRGPGTTTSDEAGLYALSNREWVIKASSSMKYGPRAMRSVNEGKATIIPDGARGFARGGTPARFTVESPFPSSRDQSTFASSVGATAVRLVKPIATAVAKEIANSGGGGGRFNPGLNGALQFAKSQAGKPYIWGGVGPRGYDCSGFMSAITNVILGRSPYRRLFATGSFPTSMFARGMGAFSIGSFRGNPGHMAGTLNGVNVESRGGRGSVVGAAARGARNALFGGNVWHLKGFAKGGEVGDPPFDLLSPRGKQYAGMDLADALGIKRYDTGGKWRSGTLGYNGTGKTETVRTAEQEADLKHPVQVRVFIGDRELRDMVRVEVDGVNSDAALTYGLRP